MPPERAIQESGRRPAGTRNDGRASENRPDQASSSRVLQSTLPARPLESFGQTAKRYNLSQTSLRRWWERGEVPRHLVLVLGGRHHIRVKSFAAWIEGLDELPATGERPPLRAVS